MLFSSSFTFKNYFFTFKTQRKFKKFWINIFFSVKVSKYIQGYLLGLTHFVIEAKPAPWETGKGFEKKLYLNFKCFLIINPLVKIRSFSTYKINFWINLRIFSYFANKSSYRCSGSLSNHLFWFSGGFLKTGFSRTLNTELLPVYKNRSK